MGVVLLTALVLVLFVAFFRWLSNPHITVIVINETAGPITEVRVSYGAGERTADRMMPDTIANSDIRCAGEDGVDFSYTDRNGVLREKKGLAYIESGYRGYIEIHVRTDGVSVFDGIRLGPYQGWMVPVRPKDEMKVWPISH
jgi:hypothetical protein